MKKIINIAFVLLTTGFFTACQDDNNPPVAEPGGYEQGPVYEASFSAMAQELASPFVIDEDNLESTLNTFTVTPPELQNEATARYEVIFAKTADFENYVSVPATVSGNNVMIPVAELDEIVKDMFGKKPQSNKFFAAVAIRIMDEGTMIMLYSDKAEIAVTPLAPVIEEGYYVIGDYYVTDDDIVAWTPDILLRFNRSSKDVYEDPIFTLLFEVKADSYIKIAPESSRLRYEESGDQSDFWDGVLGISKDGDTALEGELDAEFGGAIKIEEAGFVKITLNMEEYTYIIEPLDVTPFLYVPGNHQGWSPETAKKLYSADMDLIYRGHIYLDGEFKLTGQDSWGPVEYGSDGADGLTSEGGGNINADPAFYYVEVNLNDMSYTLTETVWGLIGDATQGGWDNSTVMLYDGDTDTWSVTTDLLPGGFKFRANEGWDINMGGDPDNLVEGGDNISVNEAGSYTIVLYLENDLSSKCTITRN